MQKTLSFAVIHFTIAFGLTYAMTGSFLTGSVVALIEPAVNTAAFYLHDRFWPTSRKPTEAEFAMPHCPVSAQ